MLCDGPHGWDGRVGDRLKTEENIRMHKADPRCFTAETNILK